MDLNHLDKWPIVLSFPTKPSVCDVEASIKELLQVSLDAKAAGEWTTTEPFDYEGDSTSSSGAMLSQTYDSQSERSSRVYDQSSPLRAGSQIYATGLCRVWVNLRAMTREDLLDDNLFCRDEKQPIGLDQRQH